MITMRAADDSNTTYVPGFFKIFDEILVNAADNKVRPGSLAEIRTDGMPP